ncbi:MAG TPA: hypothetical protein VLT36_08175 [Candidatus Dormibacteraeota bacterium]|nr:hypothetical protein [Candidatus Dormibacteraeota bacterium]
MKMKICISVVLIGVTVESALSCDLCAIYSATEAQGGTGRGFFGGVAEQFTEFGTLQDNGQKIGSEGQYIHSSVSQVFAGYNFNDRISLQLNLPVIYHAYGSDTQHGTVSGIGELSLTGNFKAYEKLAESYTFDWTLLGGVKFPTGDSSKLNTPDEDLPEGIGGHDLALGSGSYDGIVGTGFYGRWKRGFFSASVQYSIRSEGDFEHQYANDLTWFGGPGVYLGLTHDYALSLEAIVSGENKGKDTFSAVEDPDSAETLVYLGPQINFTWRSKLSVLLAADLPVFRDNSGVQVMPDYRVRGAFTWRF